MSKAAIVGWCVAVGLGIVMLTRHTPPAPISRIVTEYDTVKVIDTAWVTRLTHDTVYQTNIVERVVRTPPETIRVVPPLVGVSAVAVPQKRGDSTLVLGFRLTPLDTGYAFARWQYQYWTPGPLKSIALTPDGTPAVAFYDPPPTCDLRCKGKVARGAVVIAEIIRTLLGRP